MAAEGRLEHQFQCRRRQAMQWAGWLQHHLQRRVRIVRQQAVDQRRGLAAAGIEIRRPQPERQCLTAGLPEEVCHWLRQCRATPVPPHDPNQSSDRSAPTRAAESDRNRRRRLLPPRPSVDASLPRRAWRSQDVIRRPRLKLQPQLRGIPAKRRAPAADR